MSISAIASADTTASLNLTLLANAEQQQATVLSLLGSMTGTVVNTQA